MTQTFRAACIQLDVGSSIEDNLKITQALIEQAVEQGAQFIATPENTCFLDGNKKQKLETARKADPHPVLQTFSELAKTHHIWLLAGSIKLPVEKAVTSGEDRLYNRSYLFGPDGKAHQYYDKIHLYDVDLPTGEVQRESEEFKAGEKSVIVDIPQFNAKLGMTICYDVRFPHLYRDMAIRGADIFTIPAAFTVPTGEAHWEVMLRARAIECGAFVLAPAQGGEHKDKQGVSARKTYGHSMIIDPWGRIIAHKDDDKPGVILADIDLAQVSMARNAIQQLKHDKDYSA